MPKTRAQKQDILTRTTDRLQRSQSAVFVSIAGVKVKEVEAIRDALFADGLQLQVAKNSLFKLALAEQSIEVPAEVTNQSFAVVYSYEDVVASAKLTAPLVKEVKALEVLGGIMDGAYITPAQVSALANLPSREQLLGQLVGTLAAPMSGMVNVLAGNLRGLVTVLTRVQEGKAS